MDNLDMELPRKLDAATIAALFPDLDAVRSRVANWLRFLDRVSRERNFPLFTLLRWTTRGTTCCGRCSRPLTRKLPP